MKLLFRYLVMSFLCIYFWNEISSDLCNNGRTNHLYLNKYIF